MRASSHVRVLPLLTVLWALAAAPASAQDVFHLRAGGVLVPDAPAAGSTTAVLSTRIPTGEDALLGTFTSLPLDHDIVIGEAIAVVYLGTGRPGMDGCARVTTLVARLSEATSTEVANGSLVTTIRPRRRVTDPVVVPMTPAVPLLAAAGERLFLQIRVENECGGERNVSLLYGSVGRASRIELLAPGATTSTSTTVITPTTDVPTTTTTLSPTCLEVATGLAGVRCRLEMMDTILRTTSPASLGGSRFVGRLSRRVERALAFVRASELIAATPRRLRKGRRQVMRFTKQLSRGQADGRVAPNVGGSLGTLSASALAGLNALIVGG